MIHVTVQIVSEAPLIQIIFGPAVTSVPERGPEYEIVGVFRTSTFCPEPVVKLLTSQDSFTTRSQKDDSAGAVLTGLVLRSTTFSQVF